MRHRTPQRAMVFALFIASISFFNFEKLTGCDCIRTLHILTLLTCGIGIGVFLSNLFTWLRSRNKDNDPPKV
jgi:hypothetical protein